MRPLPAGAGPVILGGDVGGTKTWLGIFRAGGSDAAAPLLLQRAAKFSSRSAASLEQLVAEFLADDRESVDYACFGLPGPVGGNRAKLVNLPWEIDADAQCARFGFRGTFLINDLVANAYGIGELDPADFAVLHAGDPSAAGNMAVISPGTGLGEAGIFWDGRKHIPFACEGGHTDFAPRTAASTASTSWPSGGDAGVGGAGAPGAGSMSKIIRPAPSGHLKKSRVRETIFTPETS